jgi:hypothetical protein
MVNKNNMIMYGQNLRTEKMNDVLSMHKKFL